MRLSDIRIAFYQGRCPWIHYPRTFGASEQTPFSSPLIRGGLPWLHYLRTFGASGQKPFYVFGDYIDLEVYGVAGI